jgi:hypothetical protein
MLPAALALVAVAWVVASARVDEDRLRRGQIVRSTDNVRAMLVYWIGSGAGLEKSWPSLRGKRFALGLVATNKILRTDERQLEILFSPGDRAHSLTKAGGPKAYADLTLAKLEDPSFDVSTLTSYAGPEGDANTPVAATGQQSSDRALLADLSFPGGVILGFVSGAARWVSAAELGLSPDQPIVIGPASPVEMLRQLSDH